MESSDGEEIACKLFIIDARSVVIKKYSRTGEEHDIFQENKTLGGRYRRWTSCKPPADKMLKITWYPAAQINILPSGELKMKARVGKSRHYFFTSQITGGDGNEFVVDQPENEPGRSVMGRPLVKHAKWYMPTVLYWHGQYELRLQSSDSEASDSEASDSEASDSEASDSEPGDSESGTVLATVTHTPFEWIIEVLNEERRVFSRSMTDKFWDALNKHAKKRNLNRLGKLVHFAARCILLEAALVTFFLSHQPGQQYKREDVTWIFCPDKKTNEILPAIFRHPYDPIRVQLTFIPAKPGDVIDHTQYNVGRVNDEHGMKVVGLWDDRPVLFREKEIDFTFDNITVYKRDEISPSRLEYKGEINGVYFVKIVYIDRSHGFTLKFRDVALMSKPQSAFSGIQILRAGMFALLKAHQMSFSIVQFMPQ